MIVIGIERCGAEFDAILRVFGPLVRYSGDRFLSVTDQTITGQPSRRLVLLATPFLLAGCATAGRQPAPVAPIDPRKSAEVLSQYGARPEERFPLAAADLSGVDPKFLRRQVRHETGEPVGTIVVDPAERYLYLIQEGGMAMRYGIGVGREGFGWSGRAVIRRKAAWPRWTPPAEMVARDEKAARWAGGMPPGLDNPLGARALYLYEGDRDTLYRIHGTNEPWSIGSNVSSGCIRMINQDVIDLYDRIPVGTAVIVLDATSLPERLVSGLF